MVVYEEITIDRGSGSKGYKREATEQCPQIGGSDTMKTYMNTAIERRKMREKMFISVYLVNYIIWVFILKATNT